MLSGIIDVIENLRSKGNDITFTNGCFDMLHAGHCAILREAKNMSPKNILIVAINSDVSIKKIKGESRPIVPGYQRLFIVKSLKYVDIAFLFDEETPYKYAMHINPDYIVKGGEWENNVEYSQFARKDTIFIKHEFSDVVTTSSIIERLTNEK